MPPDLPAGGASFEGIVSVSSRSCAVCTSRRKPQKPQMCSGWGGEDNPVCNTVSISLARRVCVACACAYVRRESTARAARPGQHALLVDDHNEGDAAAPA